MPDNRLSRFFNSEDAEYDAFVTRYQAKTLTAKASYLGLHLLPKINGRTATLARFGTEAPGVVKMKSNPCKAVIFLMFLVCAASGFAQTAPKPLELLRQKLEQISSGVSADWGIYVKSLDTGEEIAINADAAMDTMSVIMVPLLVDAYRLVDAGQLHPADRFVMTTADKRFGTGVLRTLDPGLNLSVHDALELMIIQSDNSATDMVFSRVGGPAHVTATMHQLGLNSIRATGTSFDWFRALAEAGDPAYAQLTPEQLFTKGFPEKLTDAEV